MRTSRGRRVITTSYIDGSSPEGSPEAAAADDEWVPRLDALPGGKGAPVGFHAPAGAAAGVPAAPAQQQQQGDGAAAAAAAAHPALDWEEAELLAQLSPESQKRERRRIANRDCARRIRQRQTVSGRAGGHRPAACCTAVAGCCALRSHAGSRAVRHHPAINPSPPVLRSC